MYDPQMKVISVVGARPQFVKLSPIDHAFKAAGIEHVIVHTGQHYDHEMSESFFEELDISKPAYNLEVGSASHGVQTGQMLIGLEKIFLDESPDWVLVYGDTNSTLAGTLAAVKIHLKVAHLEAGLRSFNRAMPEEHNRVVTDHTADLLLAPSQIAMEHLKREGLEKQSLLVGDVMTDVCFKTRDRVLVSPSQLPPVVESMTSSEDFHLATIHRAENTDDPVRLTEIITSMQNLKVPTLLLAHPRLIAKAAAIGLELEKGTLRIAKPVSYPEMVYLISKAKSVITDSGGLQKEAFLLKTLCTTIRTETEWPETLVDGWNVLQADPQGLEKVVDRQPTTDSQSAPYGDGNTAQAVVQALKNWR
jgi:UDP-N-acetylglucosamine 2-epimerase (non-hydrolysing)